MAIMRAREEDARKPARPTRPMMVLHGGTWEETAGAPDWGEWPAVDAGGGGEKVAAAMEAALPLAEEFSEKMSELAEVVPELSRTLVSLTEVRAEGSLHVCVHLEGVPQGIPETKQACSRATHKISNQREDRSQDILAIGLCEIARNNLPQVMLDQGLA